MQYLAVRILRIVDHDHFMPDAADEL